MAENVKIFDPNTDIDCDINGYTTELVEKSCVDFFEAKLPLRRLTDNATGTNYLLNPYQIMGLPHVKNMEIYEDDIWVVTFPKAGTTWTQAIVQLILECKARPNELPQRSPSIWEVSSKCPMIELQPGIRPETGLPGVPLSPADWLQWCSEKPRQRHLKSHLPWEFLPRDICKSKYIIHVMRNPKDLVVSLYHFCVALPKMNLKVDNIHEFVDEFVNDRVIFSKFLDYELGYWKERERKNMLCLKFEDMKKNPSIVVQQIASFLDVALTAEQVDKIVDLTTFSSMKKESDKLKEMMDRTYPDKNTAVYGGDKEGSKKPFNFMRKGEVGGWRDELSEEDSQKIEKKFDEAFAAAGLKFEYV